MANLIGALGVALLLAAFLLNLVKRMSADGYAYSALNLVGGGLAWRSAAKGSALLEDRAQVGGQIVRQAVLTHEKP